ncbi:JK_62P [Escherichia phage Jk06]|uniref:JK_62P n=1 Tax=Escherichia phage Jk06 TaxID=2886922 RepID=Q45PV3_9CAUD|nr:hypothetical protein JK_62 [Escherichia phage Jk06]AAZ29312.1 JK_62P [Escherichia phage Jk06]
MMEVPRMTVNKLTFAKIFTEICSHCCQSTFCFLHCVTMRVSKQCGAITSLVHNCRANINMNTWLIIIECSHCSTQPNHRCLVVVAFNNLNLNLFMFHKHFSYCCSQ